MGDITLRWTPRDELNELSLSLTALSGGAGLTKFTGWAQSDRKSLVTVSGRSLALVHHAWLEYDLRIRAIDVASVGELWSRMAEFTSHADSGAVWAFEMDSAKVGATLLDGCCAQLATTLAVDDSSGFTAGEYIRIIDAADPTKWQIAKIDALPTGTSMTLDTDTPTAHGFEDDSPITYHEFFPYCVTTKEIALYEREGGSGAYLWDLELRFRTVLQ